MPRYIELTDKTIVDMDSITSLYQDGDEWFSDTADGDDWAWDEKDVPLIREAMLTTPMVQGAFVCQYCGAPNVVREEKISGRKQNLKR